MARVARVVAPGVPHHVTQRGNRRQSTFFCEDDYRFYKALLAEMCDRHQVKIWAYCLMPNHVHLIAVPSTTFGLRLAIGEAHRRYTSRVNKREHWTGHLWQGRFFSYPMDETHLLRAVRYIELNPVRAGYADAADQYPWSSAKARLLGTGDRLVELLPLGEMVQDWRKFLAVGIDDKSLDEIRHHQNTGRPLGDSDFVRQLEEGVGRTLAPQRKGRKPKQSALFEFVK